MTREEMLQDIAYARTLAEEGRNAPLIGGAYFVWFGVLLAACYAMQWAVLNGLTPFEGPAIGATWLAFGVAAVLGSIVLSLRVRKMPGGSAIPNRVDRHIWQGVAFAIVATVFGAILRMLTTADYTAPDVIVAAGFGLYGVALYVTGTVGGHTWLRAIAFLAWGVSFTLWYFLHAPWTYLFAAIASVAVLIVPGLIMMRREPKTIV
jgi:hypothetical protein